MIVTRSRRRPRIPRGSSSLFERQLGRGVRAPAIAGRLPGRHDESFEEALDSRASPEASRPVIKLPPDWTFVAQIVCFLVLWQVMRWALFEPVQRALAARAARTTGDRASAEALRGEASALAADIEAQLAEARRESGREAEEIRRRGEGDEQAILARYRDEALAVLERERGT